MPRCRHALVVAILLGLALPAFAETISVPTFNREFFNWATVHEQTFTFPEQQLYSQVLCNIVIACPQAPADCDPWDRLGWLRLKHEVSPGVFEGTANITGTISAFFRGGPLFSKFIDDLEV